MRNILAGLSGTSGMVAAGGVAAVLIAAGYWVSTNRAEVPVAEEVVAVVSKETAEAAAPVVEEEPVEAAPAAPANPSFDEVRREADGMTVIAGQGAPGADVWVLQDGTEVAQAKVDASGAFAMIAQIPPDGQAHVLTLLQRAEGGEQASDGEIILAPLAAPVVVAEAEPVQEKAEAAEVEAPVVVEEETQVAEAASEETVPAVTEQETAAVTAEVETPAAPVVEEGETTAVAEAEVVEAPATEVAEESTQVEVVEAPAATEEETVVAETVAVEDETEAVASATKEESVVVASVTPEVEAEVPAAPAVPAATAVPESETAEAPETETTAVAVLKSTAEGVELLNTTPPEVMDNVALDTISYSDVGEVQLAGRAQSEASAVRVYLNNASVVDLPVDAEGRWRGELPDVDEGVYTLRVDEVSEDGQVTSRVETPFKREAPEVLAAAAEGQEGPIKAITVQRGATLWAIARERYGDGQLYVRVFEANRSAIRDPDLIYPGQIFDLPD